MSISDEEVRLSEHEKFRVEIAKIMAETTKINAETKWYPTAALAGIAAAVIALVIKLFVQ